MQILKHLENLYPADRYALVEKGLRMIRPTMCRLNTLKAHLDEVKADLEKNGFDLIEFTEIANAYFIFEKNPASPLMQTASIQQGWIYLQSFSSQIPVWVLDPRPSERILDMAAAPGGKTSQIAALMKNQGEIVAMEPDKIRAARLLKNIERLGVTNATVKTERAEKISVQDMGLFDKILLDAPCSSEGTFLLTEPETFQHWSLDFVKSQANKQRVLLNKAFELLKPGGVLVYSTCALSCEENEAQLDWLFYEFKEAKPLSWPLKFSFMNDILSLRNIQKRKSLQACAKRIDPKENFEGFFVSRIGKR